MPLLRTSVYARLQVEGVHQGQMEDTSLETVKLY